MEYCRSIAALRVNTRERTYLRVRAIAVLRLHFSDRKTVLNPDHFKKPDIYEKRGAIFFQSSANILNFASTNLAGLFLVTLSNMTRR